MASPPGSGGSLYAGRVVDPDVREDGETEPEVELNPSPPGALASEAGAEDASLGVPAPPEPEAGSPSAVSTALDITSEQPAATVEPTLGSDPAAAPTALGRGTEVRERLLAKARAAEQARAEQSALDNELESVGRSSGVPAPSESDDLVLPATSGRAPSAPIAPIARELSPTLVAIFSALVGMAAIASITALFMSIETRAPERALAAAAPTAAKSAAPATASAPAEPKAKPKRPRQKIPGPWRLGDAKGDARYRFIEGKVGTDSFLKALEAAGAAQTQGFRVLAAMRGVLDLDKCKKTDRFQALLERGSGRLFAFEYLSGPDEIYQAKEVDGRLTGSKLDLKVERGQIVGALSYDGESFEKSAELAGFDPGLSKVVARALDGHMALDELDRGDVLRVVAQEVTVLGEFARYAGIEALELIRADAKKTKLRIYYSDAPGIRGYYDHDGRAPFEGGWRKPVKDAPRTSPFNPKRLHPVLKKVMPHNGTDYGAPTGTPVGASSFGTVSFIGSGGPSGNLVKIMHPGGVETGYAHLSRFAEGLKLGDKVKRLQVIGYVGSTGRSTGPHLHFTAQRDGKFFDAETLNLDGMRNLSSQEREAFKPIMAKYDPMLDSIPMPEAFAPLILAKAEPVPAASAAAPAAVHEDGAVGDPDEEGVTPPSGAPAAAGATPRSLGGSAVYLSDKELLEAQTATDDGEVEE